MRVIIAGSRDLTNPKLVDHAIAASGFEITCVLSGKARGIDKLGEDWAKANGIPVDSHPADWAAHGRHLAGRIRNAKMASLAEALIAIWDGKSPGTANMLSEARKRGLKVFVLQVGEAAD